MKSFGSLINSDMRATIHDDRRLKQLISQIVPASTARHIVFCRLENERLRISVDNAVWVQRLRFMERQLIDILRQDRLLVSSVSCHVIPAEKPVVRTTQRDAAHATPQTASQVLATANAIDDDALSRALRRMANNMVKRR